MMNESKFSVTNGARLVAVAGVLLMALAMLLAFSAKPAEAGLDLGGAGGSTSNDLCPPGGLDGYPNGLPPTWAVTWSGTDANELKCGSTGVFLNGATFTYYGGDTLNGMGGSDQLFGLGRADKLYGGTGNDKLYGQSHDDQIVPGDGADYVEGGQGKDTVIAAADGQKDIFYGDLVEGSPAQARFYSDSTSTDFLKITSCGGLDSVDEVHGFELVSRPSC